MNQQYREYAYLEKIAKFVSDVVMMSGMHENAALAKIVVSDIYQNIKKNHEIYGMKFWQMPQKSFAMVSESQL